MNHSDFLNFRDQLKSNLEPLDSVTGLVFVGSAADISRVDEWSDHDFFVFTTEGRAEALRQDLTWLPAHEDIALFVRETEHGLKVVYNSGHLLEFAVFEPDWELAGVNAYEVTLDKGVIADRLATAQLRSAPQPLDVDRELSLFLSHLLIGTGRFRRGEILSAGQFINSFCVNSAIRLVSSLCPPANGTEPSVDNQNPFRRFEMRYPELANELEVIQRMTLESGAKMLLELVTKTLAEHLDQRHFTQIAVIKTRLGW